MITVCKFDGIGLSEVTPDNFVLNFSRHWYEYTKYKKTTSYIDADSPLQSMINRKKGMSKPFISSDIEIKKILDVLGSSFIANYSAYGFSVTSQSMLGMQLFEYCVFDKGYNWWYFVPKPLLDGHLLPHSHYLL